MKRWIAALLALLLITCPPALADTAACFSREGAPYWHADANCAFAETGWYADTLPALGEARVIAAAEAEAQGQKPCPSCASSFPPTFTGDFPEWTHDVAPWSIDSGEMIELNGWPRSITELPAKTLAGWGDPADKLRELFPEETDPATGELIYRYPDDYAGIFVNACGGYTILLKDPTPERMAEWRSLLCGEFWVIAAKYSCRDLQALRGAARGFMDVDGRLLSAGRDAIYHIVSISIDTIGNALEIGVAPERFNESAAVMREGLRIAGFDDPDMVRFIPAEYPSSVDL